MKTLIISIHLVAALSLLSTAAVAAEKTCFSDKASWEKVKAGLPKKLQSAESIFEAKGALSGGVKLAIAEDGIRVHLAVRHSLAGAMTHSQPIKRLCLEKNGADSFTLTADAAGKEEQFTLKSLQARDVLEAKGFHFESSPQTPAWEQVLARVNRGSATQSSGAGGQGLQ